MQRFAFRLERVMQWQLKVCRLSEENLRLARLAVSDTEARIKRLKSDSLTIEHEMLVREMIASPDLRALARYRVKTVEDERSLILHRHKQLQTVEDLRNRLAADRNRLRLIEKLRDRAQTEYTLALDRELEALALESHLSKWTASPPSPDSTHPHNIS